MDEWGKDEVIRAVWPSRQKTGLLTRYRAKYKVDRRDKVHVLRRRGSQVWPVSVDASGWVQAENDELILVACKAFDFRFAFAHVIRDENDSRYDLELEGKFWFQDAHDAAKLVKKQERAIAAQSRHDATELLEWARGELDAPVRDSPRTYGWWRLSDCEAKPASWWESRLNEWLWEYGLSWRVRSRLWTSDTSVIVDETRKAIVKREQERQVLEKEKQLRELQEDLSATLRDQETQPTAGQRPLGSPLAHFAPPGPVVATCEPPASGRELVGPRCSQIGALGPAPLTLCATQGLLIGLLGDGELVAHRPPPWGTNDDGAVLWRVSGGGSAERAYNVLLHGCDGKLFVLRGSQATLLDVTNGRTLAALPSLAGTPRGDACGEDVWLLLGSEELVHFDFNTHRTRHVPLPADRRFDRLCCLPDGVLVFSTLQPNAGIGRIGRTDLALSVTDVGGHLCLVCPAPDGSCTLLVEGRQEGSGSATATVGELGADALWRPSLRVPLGNGRPWGVTATEAAFFLLMDHGGVLAVPLRADGPLRHVYIPDPAPQSATQRRAGYAEGIGSSRDHGGGALVPEKAELRCAPTRSGDVWCLTWRLPGGRSRVVGLQLDLRPAMLPVAWRFDLPPIETPAVAEEGCFFLSDRWGGVHRIRAV